MGNPLKTTKLDTTAQHYGPPDGPECFDFRVFIATPAYDGRVLSDYALALSETSFVSMINGIYTTATIMGNGAFIDIARNHFVRMFLETNATHLFYIDADVRWEARAFIELVRANLPICAGAYRKRQEPEEYPIRYVSGADGTVQTRDGWVLADRVATGFLCIRRDVIQRMVDEGQWIKVGNERECPRLFYTKYEDDGRFIGEDYSFCDDYVRIFKQPIPVWPDFDFTHGARFEGNFHKWLLAKSKEFDEKEWDTAKAAGAATGALTLEPAGAP